MSWRGACTAHLGMGVNDAPNADIATVLCCGCCCRLCIHAQVVAKVDEFKPQELANVVWALASMEHYSPEVMEVGLGTYMHMC